MTLNVRQRSDIISECNSENHPVIKKLTQRIAKTIWMSFRYTNWQTTYECIYYSYTNTRNL